MNEWLKKQLIKTKNYVRINKKYSHLYIIAGIFIFAGVIAGFAYSFALPEEVKEVVIDSDNYGDSGSYRVKKSANWVATNQAKITFDFNSISKLSENKNYDILLVLDISGSMEGDKLRRVKEDSTELVNAVLKDSNNKVGVITFATRSSIITDFTNDKEKVLNHINSLSDLDNTNYYDALVNVDTVMKNYHPVTDKECIVLFLTDGYPNVKTPNEIGQYRYLKSEYPYLQINAIQYEMGEDILDPIKKISDHQFIADMETLNNTLFGASISIPYERVKIVDYINSEYFYVESENDIIPSIGTVKLEKDGDKQKVIWTIDDFSTGVKANLEIVVKVKKASIETEDAVYMPTNEKEIITTKLENEDEVVKESNLSPILKNYYDVVYDLNLPDVCNITSISGMKYLYGVSVPIKDDLPDCGGYQFVSWHMVIPNVKRYNDDNFVMPDYEVKLVAVWEKIAISKSMDGTIYDKITGAEKLINKVGTGGLVEEIHSATTQLSTTTDYRYTGANPDNYISFNNETWRIIGVFDVDNGSGKMEKRIKIIREPLEKMAWSTSNLNNWSTASSKNLFNAGDYYNRTEGSSYENIGLTEEAKSQIADAKWYLGGTDDYLNLLVNNWYVCERDMTVYSGNPTSWVGKMGLMYPSDYGYATSGGSTVSREECLSVKLYEWRFSNYSECNTQNWLYNSGNNQWTMTASSSSNNNVHYITSVGGINAQYGTAGYNAIMIRPSTYLKSDIRLVGEGTESSPYEIS